MIDPLKRFERYLVDYSWTESRQGYFRAALEMLATAGATTDEIDAYCELWPAAYGAHADDCNVPCPRCFMVGRTRWLVRAAVGVGVHDGSGWRVGFVCNVCGYTPYIPPSLSDGPAM